MPTPAQRNRLRGDVGVNATSMSDPLIDDYYARAAEEYPDSSKAQEAYARILALRQLKAQAAKLTDYNQNDTQEKFSQLVPNLDRLIKDYQIELALALESTEVGVHWGGMKGGKPTRLKDYPDA